MKSAIKYIIIGFVFGITMLKSEAISWFRIYEMFHFQSFHMYGIIGTAFFLGLIITLLFKKNFLKGFRQSKVEFKDKAKSFPRYLFGGILFGLGWGLGGLCPGPLYVMLGSGITVFFVFFLAALLGTYIYAFIKKYLPH